MEINILETLSKHEERILGLETGSQSYSASVEQLKSQMSECEKIQTDLKEHSRRSEDALNNNTKSNLLLVESNAQLALAFSTLKEHIEKVHEPVIAWYAPHIQTGNDIKAFFRINKVVFTWIAGAVISGAAFYTAIKVFL